MHKQPHVKLSGDLKGDYVVLAQRANGSLRLAPMPTGGAPVVLALKQTCPSCPAQWEGTLEDGRSLYARYRGGELNAGLGDDIEAAVRNSWSEETLYSEHVGDCLDGFMDFEELRTHLYGLLDFPDELVVEGESGWGMTLPTPTPTERD